MIDNLPPGLFYISADCGESFGHYLGRFRRANELSRAGLAELLAVPAAMVQAWETPSRQTVPIHCQLSRLSEWVSLSPARLGQMLPSDPAAIRLNPRLCPVCYPEVPIHRQTWQLASVGHCARHHQPLLRNCPACRTTFRLPALWERGMCEHCWLAFSQMSSSSDGGQ